jgi:hypothetical protein
LHNEHRDPQQARSCHNRIGVCRRRWNGINGLFGDISQLGIHNRIHGLGDDDSRSLITALCFSNIVVLGNSAIEHTGKIAGAVILGGLVAVLIMWGWWIWIILVISGQAFITSAVAVAMYVAIASIYCERYRV